MLAPAQLSFTATAVLILGLGVATAVFTVYHGVLRRRLPVRDKDGLVVFWGEVPRPFPNMGLAYRS